MTTPNLFQRTGFIISATLLLLLYLLITLFTDYSLTGFRTDVIFFMLLSSFVVLLITGRTTKRSWRIVIARTLIIICALAAFSWTAIVHINPFILDHLKLRSFYFQKVNGRMFNAYFKPVGSYSGGEGNFWITESPVYFPLVEKEVYYEHAVLHNFRNDYWEGEPIDNYEVVKSYIKDEVINKGR
jgi:hypothetical protein